MAESGTKLIQVDVETWNRLGSLKKWPDRMNFNDVIKWLFEQLDTTELLK